MKTEVGTVDVGYKRFRTFYDGVGGFFPLNRQWLPLKDRDLHTDRGSFWANASLQLKGAPVLSLRYLNETRTGSKDSIVWGDSNLTGLPTVPSGNAARKLLPDLLTMDERHQLLQGRVEFTRGETTAALTVTGDWVNNNNRRNFTRFAGEVTPSPERVHRQIDLLSVDTLSVIATTVTKFNERWTLNTGWSYQEVDSSVGGERANAIGVFGTYDFRNLVGGSEGDTYAANAALSFRPNASWYFQGAIRGESSRIESEGTFERITGTTTLTTATYREGSRRKDDVVTPELNVRYTGIPKVVLYAMARDRLNQADRRSTAQYNATTAPLGPPVNSLFSDDLDQDQAHYLVGANWNQSSRLTLRTEVFVKDHENRFVGYANRIGGLYVLGYQYTGVKFTAMVKPTDQVSVTTRYVPQYGTMEVTTDSTAKWDSMTSRTHLVGLTVDWNPTAQFYLQANLDLGFNYISTAYPEAQTPATIAPQRNADNNYLVESLVAGMAVSKKTNLELLLTHQHAHNYQPEIASGTMPYGAGYSEDSVTVAIKHQLRERLRLTAKLGYISSENETTGGNTDFDGPVAYLAFDQAL